MKTLLVFLAFLLSCSCNRRPVAEPVDPLFSTPTPLVLDSASSVAPDSPRVVEGPKTVVVEGKKIKLKRGATLVINQGQGNSATTVGKAKNSTLATGAGAVATDNHKAGYKANGGVAVGENNSATGSTQIKEAGWPWYVWLVIAGAVGYGLYRLNKWLGL